MHRLIVNLLDAQADEEGMGQLSVEPCDLAAMVVAAADHFQPAAATKRITISRPAPSAAVTVLANHDALMRVLDNLLSNAVEFAPVGGTVAVAIDAPPGANRARPTGAESSHGLGLFTARCLAVEQGRTIRVVAPGPLRRGVFRGGTPPRAPNKGLKPPRSSCLVRRPISP